MFDSGLNGLVDKALVEEEFHSGGLILSSSSSVTIYASLHLQYGLAEPNALYPSADEVLVSFH